VHNGQPKPNLRHKIKVQSGLEGLLEMVALEVIAESVRAGTHSKHWREKVPKAGRLNKNGKE